MRRVILRLVTLSAMVVAFGAVFTGTAFAGVGPPVGPFMPCCFNPVTGAATKMFCCIINISMECCKRFL